MAARRAMLALLLLVLSASAARAAVPGVSRRGEIVIVQGDDQILAFDGIGYALLPDGLAVVARRVLEEAGDQFQALTVWMTFEDQATGKTEAYQVPIKNDVLGLHLPLRDRSRSFGSNGVLRSMVNMKTLGMRPGETMDSWRSRLEIWGQEGAHSWMVFLLFKDPRTGLPSDALLGRDCAHYSRFVDTQASVHDGLAWTDNHDGTFTSTEYATRYGNLDLYGMGLLPADEVPPFFLIDDIPGYRYPASCAAYGTVVRPPGKTITGKRVDITIADVIAASGARQPPPDAREDYWREAEVILTAPAEAPDSPTVQGLADRIDRVRPFWEQWNREASGHRLVVCTQVSADCGDPRSDVTALTLNAAGGNPLAAPVLLDVQIRNSGPRAATGLQVIVEVTPAGAAGPVRVVQPAGAVDPGAEKMVSVPVDLRALACGSEVSIKATVQSDFHRTRRQEVFVVGPLPVCHQPPAGGGCSAGGRESAGLWGVLAVLLLVQISALRTTRKYMTALRISRAHHAQRAARPPRKSGFR
jgi:hypothetical protein